MVPIRSFSAVRASVKVSPPSGGTGGRTGRTMQAIAVKRFGDEPTMMEVDVPRPGPGELEVVIDAAATNPLDQAVAAGYLAQVGDYRFPLVRGFDGAGTVRRVGGGVRDFAVGDRLFGQFWSNPMQFGTHAEVSIVQAEPALGALALIPRNVSSVAAAAAPTAAMTAFGALDQIEARKGDTVIVIGAAGGVGTFALQEAAARGLRVIAIAALDVAAYLRGLGAVEVLPKDRTALADSLAQLSQIPAAVLDFAGDQESVALSSARVRPGGTVVSTAYGISEALRNRDHCRFVDYVLENKSRRLRAVARALEDGGLHSVIGRQMRFDEALRAAQDVPHGAPRGKTVLVMR